ncbi:MAG: transcription termination factor NusA [Thermodesulfobacteriota bacterium]|nr:transcription termination factor NusA [Thermodesulfobacteriota bacterium]
MISELNRVIEELEREKNIDKTVLIDAIESAILVAIRKKFGSKREIEAHFNEDRGEIEIFEFKTVVSEMADTQTEIFFEDALKLDDEVEIGDSLGVKMDSDIFGRIAAQTAKQVIVQKVRDAERDNIYREFRDKKGEILNGFVQRIEKNHMLVNLGKTEAIIPNSEQIPGEELKRGNRIKGYVIDVRKGNKGPQIVLSRTHPGFLVKLFELEVPEMSDGIVKIKNAVREAGDRAKMAVMSEDKNVDPIGACVGIKGVRVRAVVQELKDEKIDIIRWDEDPVKYVGNSLAPAKISEIIVDEENRSMEIMVPDDQLSLAIGKKGQNVRLASKLTAWRLDIISESKAQGKSEEYVAQLMNIPGIDEEIAEKLFKGGFFAMEDIAEAKIEEIMSIDGIEEETAMRLKDEINKYLKTDSKETRETEELGEYNGKS